MAEITDVNELYNHMNLGKFFQWIDEQVSEEIVKDIVDSELDYKLIEKSTVNEFCKKYIKQAVDSFLESNNIISIN
jgi:transcriptional regulator CtsR